MIDVRPAVADDADELIRLRCVIFSDMAGSPAPSGPWQETGAAILRRGLSRTLAAFVVDDDRPGRLAACAVGTLEQRLPGPGNPDGRVGYVFNVATDPSCRRRGYSRACVRALLDFYDNLGVPVVELKATPDGEPLYASLGFQRNPAPGMRRLSEGR